VRSGKRRYLVALCLLLTAAGVVIPLAQSLTVVVILVSIAASFGNVGPAANGALVSDLLRSPADAGRAFAFLVLGGNSFGLLAPIVTGYLVQATGSFDSAFVLAGALALIGATVILALARTPIGEVPQLHLRNRNLLIEATAGCPTADHKDNDRAGPAVDTHGVDVVDVIPAPSKKMSRTKIPDSSYA
jgi:MFS family permease